MGIAFIDAVKATAQLKGNRICHNKRIFQHKVFPVANELAARGKCSIGLTLRILSTLAFQRIKPVNPASNEIEGWYPLSPLGYMDKAIDKVVVLWIRRMR